jgi:transcriptional regulator GlxA family with amidase domain
MSAPPVHIGFLLFQDFEALDAFGPLNCLNALSRHFPLQISIIAHSLSPARTWPTAPGDHSSNFNQSVLPTHTFTNPPDQLDVLFVPGGAGVNAETSEITDAVQFIRDVYPKLRYLTTICTGTVLVAKSGVLDGRKATTNKMSFKKISARFPAIDWVPKARWVVDGNIYTASGVTAGIDMTLAFIEKVYGADYADQITDRLEYDRHTDSTEDSFASKYGLA